MNLARCTGTVVAVLALIGGAQVAHARMWHVGIGGGMSVPAGDFKDALKNGVHGQGFFDYTLPGGFAGRAALNYQRFDIKSLSGSASQPTTGTSSVLSGLANLSYGLNLKMARPYITAGLGAFQLQSSPSGGSSHSDVHFGVNGGAGVQVKLGSIQGFVEGRYENLFTDKGLDPNASNSKSFAAQLIPITFGVMF